MVKICVKCQSVLTPRTNTGQLKFHCIKCEEVYDSEPNDTLMFEHKFVEDGSANEETFEQFVFNAPFDKSRNVVVQECEECGAPTLTQIYLGAEEIPQLICECGYKKTL
jgi:DNA-directed RNA polymerase subunit M/transcription elongation factor TFIIS